MPEAVIYINLALNVLLIPLLRILWTISNDVIGLKMQANQCAEDNSNMRIEIASIRQQIAATAATAAAIAETATAAAVAATTAATSAAAAVAAVAAAAALRRGKR